MIIYSHWNISLEKFVATMENTELCILKKTFPRSQTHHQIITTRFFQVFFRSIFIHLQSGLCNMSPTQSSQACKHKQKPESIFVCLVSPGAQSDSELSPHHPSEVSVDCGYKSDSEVYTEHSKTRITRSTKDVDVASSGWLVVSANIHTHTRTSSYMQKIPA